MVSRLPTDWTGAGMSESLFQTLSTWEPTTLGEACRRGGGNIQTGPFGSQLHAADYVSVGIPSIMPQNLIGDRISEESIARITPEDAERLSRYLVQDGDIVYSRRGDVERSALVRQHESGWLCGTGCLRVRFGNGIVHPTYAAYYLRHTQVREWIVRHAHGATMPNLNTSILSALPFILPPIEAQRTIAHVLGKLDDKIELNRQINQTLEHIAQAMFKSWFVDFEPVKAKITAIAAGADQHGITRAAMRALSGKTDAELDALQAAQPERYLELKSTADLFPTAMRPSELGEIPTDGWEVKPLPDIIDINPTRQLKKGAIAPYLDMANVPTNSARAQNIIEREFGSGSKFINGDTLLARITPCLENGKTAFVDFLNADQVGWGSTEFIVLRPQQFLPNEFAYFLCRHPEFRDFAISNMSGTSGRQRVPNDCFQNYIFALPIQSIAEAFGRLTGKIMADIKALDMESRTLAMLRDILLPKLLSGELDVSALPAFED